MRSKYVSSLDLITVGVMAVLATPSFAATPAASLENAQVFATGQKIQAFRVPTIDATGKVKYYNLTIDLNVLDDGTVDTTSATITSSSPLPVLSNKFIAGTYTDGQGATCTVVTTVLQGGRTQAAFSCKTSNGYTLQATWVTGLIPGHPFELDLKAAGIDKLGSYSNFSWGKVSNTTNNGDWWGCMSPNDIISASQVGNTLSIGGYQNGNTQKCGVNLTKK
ncbi:hypothetical protein [Methylomagnum ishizawai]|uniref:hypothetical protein n=1 Tax=Methylomagnum ishizawai TaxID=1760988 RepID=UPI001C3404B8|nr:hypothetical protein [Methylomagnum ishizawai]BBL74602.1 hypothetical protein MishRS11D_17000 [Methylomagnum ishizawai]